MRRRFNLKFKFIRYFLFLLLYCGKYFLLLIPFFFLSISTLNLCLLRFRILAYILFHFFCFLLSPPMILYFLIISVILILYIQFIHFMDTFILYLFGNLIKFVVGFLIYFLIIVLLSFFFLLLHLFLIKIQIFKKSK